jgi:hypothetical protein
MPLSRFARALTLMLAAIQFAGPAFASVADGAFAKLVRDPGVHVEASGDNECTPPHAADCGVCRFLDGSRSGAPDRVVDTRPLVATAAIEEKVDAIAVIAAGTARSRAPPAV